MQLIRQTGNNHGTIKEVYLGHASDYAAFVAANSGAITGFSDANIANYLNKVEFEFEKASWGEQTNQGESGDVFQYDILLKIRRMNQAVRTWRANWFYRKMMVLVFDFQGNEILFGSTDEPVRFSASKPNEQRVTDGSFYDVKLQLTSRNPV